MKRLVLLIVLLNQTTVFAQKKVLDHSDLELWNSIEGEAISPNGKHVLYSLEKGEKDHFLLLKDAKATTVFNYDRGQNGQFSYDSNYVFFTIKAWTDSVTALKSRKVKKDDLPKDSLGILKISNGDLIKLRNIKSYKIPEKWSGYVAYQLEEIKEEKEAEKDSLSDTKEKKDKPKKVDKENGYHVVLRNLNTQKEDTLKFVTDFTFAKRGQWFAYATTGEDKDAEAGIFVLNLETQQITNIHNSIKGKYYQLQFSESGKNLGFVADTDTTKIQVRPNELYLWKVGTPKAERMLDAATAPKGYRVSSDGNLSFSKDESKFFFGLASPPIIKDTTLTEDEIVNVEVWTYDEPRLYTVQELQLKNDTVQSFQSVIHLKNNKLVQLGDAIYTDTELGDEGNAYQALVSTFLPYELESQWTGSSAYDYKVINTTTGATQMQVTKAPKMNLSPKAKYAYGYSPSDSTWFAYETSSGKYKALTKGKVFYDEENDSPDFPSSYGEVGWSEDDKFLLLYDRYDIWKFDPNTGEASQLTSGRATKTVYRYITLDDERRFIPIDENWLLTTFNETTKDAGYVEFNPKNKRSKPLISGPYRYSNPKKALLADEVIYTRESFQEFPDLRRANLDFTENLVLSNANPQQAVYNWGTIEPVSWTSLDGIVLKGLLVKPENFDPNKKYPMLVNFYEKSSNNLHRHWSPKAERSTINYSFYASRGYVIFNPDVQYRIGYPGESAYNCVIPGVTSLIEKGFVDKDNIGVQGHSWGGYQIAYLVTKTDIFKAAEAGAPVPNMISAYGGIRWWTGLSRQFQYEHTQSRIGGTPWEYPQRYIENSPIFNIDKINTPLLVMHNDADGHVPWYQGIEFFVSLRRLGKPSWFLNYNGEPHWPLKLQNRKDFSLRMAQYFDYYLKGAPKPVWMERGVPAIEKGIHQGYDLIDVQEE
ncbi:MAG: prolyl oligopeptidase family serine peptidase [Flavobacteriaceae bacterium]